VIRWQPSPRTSSRGRRSASVISWISPSGRPRGALVSAPGAAAEAFLTSIDALDESRSLAEGLPPRHGVALLVRRERSDAGLAADAPESLGLAWPVRSR
jgi:hypothetical protein